jgi:hypothetical protein
MRLIYKINRIPTLFFTSFSEPRKEVEAYLHKSSNGIL